jgi:hypothetical protein
MSLVFSHIVKIINNFTLIKDQSGKHWEKNKRFVYGRGGGSTEEKMMGKQTFE